MKSNAFDKEYLKYDKNLKRLRKLGRFRIINNKTVSEKDYLLNKAEHREEVAARRKE